MLGRRRRRRAIIKTILGQCLVFAGTLSKAVRWWPQVRWCHLLTVTGQGVGVTIKVKTKGGGGYPPLVTSCTIHRSESHIKKWPSISVKQLFYSKYFQLTNLALSSWGFEAPVNFKCQIPIWRPPPSLDPCGRVTARTSAYWNWRSRVECHSRSVSGRTLHLRPAINVQIWIILRLCLAFFNCLICKQSSHSCNSSHLIYTKSSRESRHDLGVNVHTPLRIKN